MTLPILTLLPGLDGTGDNFDPLREALGVGERAVCVRYPLDRGLELDELVDHVRRHLPPEPCLVIAESFSGPVGIEVARRCPSEVVGLVLVATFRRFPLRVPRKLAAVASPLLRLHPPRWVVRIALAGSDASDVLVDRVIRSMRASTPGVIGHRLELLTRVDAGDALQALRVPVLYLQAQHDRMVPASNLEDVRRLCPDLAVECLDAPHLLLQSVPTEEERPDSDLDLAVRRAGGPIPPETWLELVSDLQQALPGRPVDLVDLATANPLLLKKVFEIARPLVAAPGAFEAERLR